MKHFPSWRYHKELEPKLIHDEKQDALLGVEWKHSPADFESKSEEPKDAEAPIEEKKPKLKKKGAA